jgi:hypothetical protein
MQYSYTKEGCNLDKLTRELTSFPISYVTLNGTSLQINTTRELTSEEITSLDTAITQHTGTDTLAIVRSSIERAIAFGHEIVSEFAAENVLLGITVEGKTGEVLTKLASVQLAVQAGSLHEAISRIRAIPETDYDTKYITASRLLTFVNRIEAYLGLPLSTEL